MRQTIRTILILGISIIAGIMTSCSDKELWIEPEMPQEVEDNLFEAGAYATPMNIKSNDSWEVKTEGDWFYVFPTSGSGDGTINICVLDNETYERRKGIITVVSTSGKESRSIEISQKSLSDYDDNGIMQNTPSVKKYAVGYGYNILGEYASPDGVTKQIVKWNDMDDKDLFQYNSPSAEFFERTVTGSSLEDLAQNLSASLNFKASYCGFKGEVGASFKGGTTSNEYNEYAISYVEYKVTDIAIVCSDEEIKQWLTPGAKAAINGTSPEYQGTEGVKKLFSEFGTHLIKKADLGGRLKYNLSVDVSKVTGHYDIAAYAKASYSNSFVDVSASLDADMKKSYENNKNAMTLSFTAYGGEASKLTDKTDKSAIETWKQSVSKDYQIFEKCATALIGFGNDLNKSLLPLYNLADTEARKQEIKAVMEGKGFVTVEYEDKNEYKIRCEDFKNAGRSATLVKNAKDENGRVVARICNEFIPEINMNERITVYYPVVSGRTLFNAGYYPGTGKRSPARISWNGNNLKIVDQGEPFTDSPRYLYLAGATFKAETTTDQSKQWNCENEPDYLKYTAIASNDKETYSIDYNYPLVKIFGNIWTREDYRSMNGGLTWAWVYTTNNAGKRSSDFSKDFIDWNSQAFYKPSVVSRPNFAPTGWEVPSAAHYQELGAMLTKYGMNAGKALRDSDSKSPVGFECRLNGCAWIVRKEHIYDNYYYCNVVPLGEQNEFLTRDWHHVAVTETDFGVGETNEIWNMNVRLIKSN